MRECFSLNVVPFPPSARSGTGAEAFIHMVRRMRLVAVLGAMTIVAAAAVSACGGGEAGGGGTPPPDDGVAGLVSPGARTYALSDLEAAAYKASKHYDVTGLPGATSAVYGFWRPPGEDAYDIEVRFYASHDDAVTLGTTHADEASGEDAVLDEALAVWKADVRERRVLFELAGRGGAGALIRPRYMDHAIRGNMAVLCGGRDDRQARDHCSAFFAAVDARR